MMIPILLSDCCCCCGRYTQLECYLGEGSVVVVMMVLKRGGGRQVHHRSHTHGTTRIIPTE